MYFDDEDERDVFEVFGEADAEEINVAQDIDKAPEAVEETIPETPKPKKVKTDFSWAAFAGGLAAFVWIAGAIGGPLSYYGVNAVLTMDPAMQAGLIALAFGPALLFWVTASAAGEALKARRLTMELMQNSTAAFQTQAGEAHAQQISNTVKTEIETLNEAVTTALDRLAELESAAQRNAMLFNEAVAASRENTAAMSHAMKVEREALAELNGELKGQTDSMAHSVGRQIRLMREASKLVKTEITAAEDALETHLSSFAAQATVMGERTAAFHHAADSAAAASASLNGSMGEMLAGLSEATRLTETAKKSTEQAVLAANESAFDLADFGSSQPPVNPDAALKSRALDLVVNAGVDLDDVLHAADLERIARCSREGATARRRAVIDAAPGAVTRIVRHVRRSDDAQDLAKQFRSRPDLAKSENKGEGSDLVRAYLLIDAALA